MFISLSRRSVPLIDRLARMIDGMEQSEDDPDQLANLFAMDHLVTRMRRNSENLLVLAGEEPVRKWTDSVPLADVARAAASEIEQYGRVALVVQPGIMVSGQAAADVVHLLAELIENATLFSQRSTQVRVTVMELGTGGVLVEVRDDGVGVSPGRLEDMNWRLDHPPPSTCPSPGTWDSTRCPAWPPGTGSGSSSAPAPRRGCPPWSGCPAPSPGTSGPRRSAFTQGRTAPTAPIRW
jgi:hypothetical protein